MRLKLLREKLIQDVMVSCGISALSSSSLYFNVMLSFCNYSFKPMELKLVVEPLKNDFEALVRESFPKSDNRQFFANIEVLS